MKWNHKGHQFDNLGKHFEQRNRLYIYGAAEYGKRFLDMLCMANLADMVDGFLDKDIKKQADGFEGKKVLSPDILFKSHEEKHVIIVAMKEPHYSWTVTRLCQAGYMEKVDFFCWDIFRVNLNEIYLPLYGLYTQNKIIVSSACYIPSDACNLLCRDCLNFTPYIKKFESKPLDQACQDIDLFFQWIDFTFRYQISGGEPLLYRNLKELIEYIGVHYRQKIYVFEIVMNGTVIPSDELCQYMSQYNMTVCLDNYTKTIPESFNHRKEIIEKLEKYHVKWIDNTVEDWFALRIFDTDHSNMTEEELIEYFDHCNNPWHYYENGKLYACNFARFAERAELNKETESVYFDLQNMTQNRKKELMEFLFNYNELGYVQLCKRCAGWADFNVNRVPVALQCRED
ncbi:MAG: hypothetical protein OSJ62_02280 [Lachnospiraceae bacterium]|nr:hypothetical protein [Lachnospiraceae bacterium]